MSQLGILVSLYAGENTDANPFAEYMWMENEEEYNRQVEELLEREFLERCFQEMLEEEDQDWFIPSRDLNNQGVGQHQQQLNGLSANDHHSSLEEVARRSILNPEAKEFIPGGIMLWPMCCALHQAMAMALATTLYFGWDI
ncbi:polyadenylate-binding protein-interacting protein 2B-like [Cololabis saira]|uniref:polyadenylate-binding protein-interacting protein 2B-like n=1 Tax=Cololabis saira TaxID=129043 RepID=UPI002AD5814E|nr:polyadenylate-binding protein-interacting protein 2B-like [Cololabis saira]